MKKLHFAPVNQERQNNLLPFLSVFLLIALRYLYFGFRYFPQLDDYIQYHNFAAQGSVPYLVKKLGLFAARPLAGLLDITVWSWLWPCMILAVLLLSAAFAASAITFRNLFARLFGTGSLFLVFYALMPLGMEGTYWVSASSRIIPGLLFAALSASAFEAFMQRGSKGLLVRAMVFQLLTFCFYEQAAVLSCALNILIALCLMRRAADHRFLYAFLCIAVAGAYFGFCALFSDSVVYGSRMQLMSPFSAYYFRTFLPELLAQFRSAFLGGGYYILVYGFIRGVLRIAADGAVGWCILLVLFVVFFAVVQFVGGKKQRGKILLPLGIGILLAFVPLLPFFFVQQPWFSLRGTVMSFVGIALFLDALFRALLCGRTCALGTVGSLLALVFCISAVSEVADYKANYEADSRVVSAVAGIAPEFPEGGKVAVLNLSASYVPELNCRYHEHIAGVTESASLLTGAVRCHNNNPNEWITYVPLPLDQAYVYKRWEYGEKTLSSMDAVYAYDPGTNTVAPLRVAYAGDGVYLLYRTDDSLYGRITETDKNGVFSEE